MTISYENMSRHELEARLHFLVNHVEYLLKEAAKKDEKIEKLEEQNKEQKVEIDRLGELFKLAQERLFGKRSERIIVEAAGQLSFIGLRSHLTNSLSLSTHLSPRRNASSSCSSFSSLRIFMMYELIFSTRLERFVFVVSVYIPRLAV